MTPEEIQKAQDLLKQYQAQLTGASEEERRRRLALIKIEDQLQAARSSNLTEYQKQLKAFQDQSSAINEEIKNSNEEINRLLEERADLKREDRVANATEISAIEARIEKEKELNKERENAQEIIKQQQLRQEEFKNTTDNLVTSITQVTQQQSGLIGIVQKGVNEGKSFGAALTEAAQSAETSFTSIVTPVNVLASIAAKVVQSTVVMVLETSSALANFNRMTTASGRLNSEILQASISARQFGANLAETVAAAQELFMSMSSFRQMAGESATTTIELATALQRAGLSVGDFGQISDLAMKGFGMSLEEATQVSVDLLGVSQQLGIPLGKLGADFNSSMAELAKFGPQGIEVFKELAAMANAAGVEMDTLLGVAKGFDTIEGAAEKTAKLNAILGSTLNSMQMLSASESERIMLIKQSIDATGQSFGSMDKFKQQAIAQAAGITNMADANKLFNTSGAKFREEMAKLTGEAGDLKAATSAATSISDKFRLTMESLAVAVGPLVSIISTLLRVVVLLLTPVSLLLNGFDFIGVKMRELTGLGVGFSDAITTALFLISAAIIYTTYQAVTLGFTFTEAFSAGLLQSMKMFATSMYNNVIVPMAKGILMALECLDI